MTCSSATGSPPPSVDGAADRPPTGALPGGVSTIERRPAGTLTFDDGAAFGVGTPPPFCSCFIRSLIEKTLPFRGLSAPPPPLAALAIDPSARDALDVPRGESAAPRLIVLIMPATNYCPGGYEQVHFDDQLCRGSVFYTPGANASNWINANKQAPSFIIYQRSQYSMLQRVPYCEHRRNCISKVKRFKRDRDQVAMRARMQARSLEEARRSEVPDGDPRVPGTALRFRFRDVSSPKRKRGGGHHGGHGAFRRGASREGAHRRD